MKIGLMGNTYRPTHANEPVTGFDMASSDLMRSFFRYSSAKEISCLYEPGHLQQEELIKLIRETQIANTNRRINMISEYDILFYGVKAMPAVDILHSVKEDAIPLLSLRENIGKPIPLTFTLHGLAEQHLLIDFFYPMILLPFKPYDAVICTSEAVYQTVDRILKRLEALGNTTPYSCSTQPQYQRHIRLEKIPLGVDTERFRPFNKVEARNKFDIPQDAFVILWFGRFSDIFKADLYPLLHVFHRLLKQNSEHNLLLILAGSQESGYSYTEYFSGVIKNLDMQERIRIIYNDDISNRTELYAVSDVFTSPVDNIQETFGLTPVEAMACGIPQIVSDWNGYRDSVVDGITGFRIRTSWNDCMDDVSVSDYLPANISRRRLLYRHLTVRSIVVDCDEYTEKLQLLIDNPKLRKDMSIASRQRAVQLFDLKNTVKKTEDVWKMLSDIARHTDSEFSVKSIPMLDYCNDFRAYPTVFINDDEQFIITKYGIEKCISDLPQHDIFLKSIDEASLLEQIMLHFRRGTHIGIAEFIAMFPDFSASQIRRTVMFLYKYDMIKPSKKNNNSELQ